jgi:DnaJ homolog subfamily C member 19
MSGTLLKAALVALVIWYVWRWLNKPAAPKPDRTIAEALKLLELPATATADEIRAAHRRLVAKVHPDTGGSAELTRQINAARDLLLKDRAQ